MAFNLNSNQHGTLVLDPADVDLVGGCLATAVTVAAVDITALAVVAVPNQLLQFIVTAKGKTGTFSVVATGFNNANEKFTKQFDFVVANGNKATTFNATFGAVANN